MGRALVTGANGHVGAHLVRELLAAGHEVVGFVRKTSDLIGIDGLDIELRYGDVLDGPSLEAAAEGCDTMFHTAAAYQTWAKNPAEVREPAVIGTRNAFAAAKAQRIGRIVYTSSSVAVGYGRAPEEIRTTADWNEEPTSVYFQAKTEAERDAHRLSEEMGVPMLVVCPTMVLGPFDYRITPSTEVIRDILNRKLITWTGGTNVVSAADVARVHRLVADKGTPGCRYIAGGTNLLVRDLGERLRALTGVKPRHVGAPRWLSYVVAFFMEMGARITGRKPSVTRDLMRDHVHRYGFYALDETRALGYEPTPADEVLTETVRWLAHLGELRPKVMAKLGERFPAEPAWLPRREEPAQLE